jgi:DNA polymerase III delta prime subunit
VTPHTFPQIVLFEGLPGSGKSTTAHLLALDLERQGRPARWYYEHEAPHPIFDRAALDRALEDGQVAGDFCERAIAGWQRLAQSAAAPDQTIILESAFFQLPLHPMLLMDWPEERIAAYMRDVEQALAPVRAVPIILRHENVEAALRQAMTWRGAWFADYLEQRVSTSAFGRARGLTGLDGVLRYFVDYRNLTDRLRQGLTLPCVVLDAAAPKDTLSQRVMDTLGLPPLIAFETAVALELFAGHYQDPASDNVLDIVTDGTHLYVDGEFKTRLIQCGPAAFEITGTPVRLEFTGHGDGPMQKIDCRANLPDLPHEWVRTA